MTNEEFEKRKEFILKQRAKFAADIQQLQETQAQTEQVVNRLAAMTREGFKDVNAKFDALADLQMRLAEAQARRDESRKLTDERLRNLIDTINRYFNRRNGRSEG